MDDTAALQAAIDSTPAGGRVDISGSHTISAPLVLDRAVTIDSPALIAGTHTSGPMLDVRASDVSLRNLDLRGVGIGGPYVQGANGVQATGPSVSSPLRRVRMERCTLYGFPDSAAWWRNVADSVVDGCSVGDALYSGVMLLSATDTDVDGCMVSNIVQRGPVVNTYGIAVSDVENTDAGRSRRVKVRGNTVKYVRDWEGIDTHGGSQIMVADNLVVGCHDGIAMVSGNSDRVTAPRDVVVTGNLVDPTGANSPRHAIRLYGSSAELASGTIRGNRILPGYVAALGGANLDVQALDSDLWMNTSAARLYGLDLADGSCTVRWVREGTKVTAFVAIEWGQNTVATGLIGLWLPVTPSPTHEAYDALGSAVLYDSSRGGAGRYGATVMVLSGDGRVFFTYGASQQVSGTVPFTFAAGDRITATLTYEVAP